MTVRGRDDRPHHYLVFLYDWPGWTDVTWWVSSSFSYQILMRWQGIWQGF